MDGLGAAVRVTPSRQHADEWAVVLAAAGIPHWMRHRLDGWALLVAPADAAAAQEALDAYDRENAGDGAPEQTDAGPAPGALAAGLGVALLLIGVFALAGPAADRGAWVARGSAHAQRMLGGEWWRAVTALTLHADAPHLLGNVVAAALLVTAVCRVLGPGIGLWLLLLAGAGGNVLAALVYASHHAAVGASTAIFGAIGILAALRIAAPGLAGAGTRRSWVVIAAALALLAMLGTGPDADLLAHLFGLLVGGGLALTAARALRRLPPPPVQRLLAAAAGAAVLAAWSLAA